MSAGRESWIHASFAVTYLVMPVWVETGDVFSQGAGLYPLVE